ncbi:hypothetical protein MBLNU459_g5637t1 [Dothideomycetes sp. NU459]
MTLSSKSLAGPGYIILNAIRVMNIIGFLAVVAASVVMLVKTSTASKFFFFDAVSHAITAITSMFLLISELSLFRSYFARNWPLLSPVHGFVTLGFAMIVLGLNVLGNLNKPATSQQSLGLAAWRIVIGSGIVVLVLGVFNLIASYVFRDSRQGITARQVRAQGAVAVHKSMSSSVISAPVMQTTSPVTPVKSPFQTATKNDEESILPSYYSASPKDSAARLSPSSKYSRATWCTKKKMFGGRKRESIGPPLPVNISAPLNINPQFAHLVQRPDSALHPSRTGESENRRFKG